ncbi:MAG TPA: glycine cleavage system aminomethyltransferase GcvT [Caulobacteraceae bacterium]|nr:glycine cleavage system aminomethyltransferase GcvT [Caulobacteraceae bacterium]
MSQEALESTVLTAAHRARGGKMVAFAGYDMPVQYPLGVLKEHLWTRAHAGAFDVSHMGPAFLDLADPSGDPDADHRAVAALIEPLITGDIAGLKPGQLRYTLLLDEAGGILDDLMIGRPADPKAQGRLYVVVNAGCKEGDFALIAKAAGAGAELIRADDGALIALQGPEAAEVLAGILPESDQLTFMNFRPMDFEGGTLLVSRSGYTGEDGFEILVPAALGERFWLRLLADERVQPIGLGARDSLRLEAGLPLYGHDLDETVSPIEAALGFAVSKKRLKAGAMRGAARIGREIADGPSRVRVGLKVAGAPAREGAPIHEVGGEAVGVVTSGGFSPTLSLPIAMGFVPPRLSAPGAALEVEVRGRRQSAEIVALPFTPHRYRRPSSA